MFKIGSFADVEVVEMLEVFMADLDKGDNAEAVVVMGALVLLLLLLLLLVAVPVVVVVVVVEEIFDEFSSTGSVPLSRVLVEVEDFLFV